MSLAIPVDHHTPDATASDSNTASGRGSRRPRNNRGRQNRPNLSGSLEDSASAPETRQSTSSNPSHRGRGRGGNAQRGGRMNHRSGGSSAGPLPSKPDESSAGELETSTSARPPPQSSRRQQFGSKLSGQAPASNSRRKGATDVPETGDLTERLISSMSRRGNEESIDCPICFISIHPAQPTWSCAPSEQTSVCCWTTFHLKCVRSWASKSEPCCMYAFELHVLIQIGA